MTWGRTDVDLAGRETGEQVWASSGSGVRFCGRTALDDVGDIDLFALEAHGLDHVVEQLAAAADEGHARCVFIRARAFADEHEAGVGVAVAEDELVAAFGEGAAGAVADFFADQVESGEVLFRRNGRSLRRCGGEGLAGGDGWILDRLRDKLRNDGCGEGR